MFDVTFGETGFDDLIFGFAEEAPAPSALALFGLGALALAARRRR